MMRFLCWPFFGFFSQIKVSKESNDNALVIGNVLSDLTVGDSLRSARIKVLKIPELCGAVVSKNGPP